MICEICRGEGRLDTLFGDKRPCPECNGSGVATSPPTWAEQQLADAKAWREEMAGRHHVSVDTLFGEPQSDIGVIRRAPPSFVCPHCGAESFNPNDIAQRYCGRCHAFIVDDWPPSPEAYCDESFGERACDFCGRLYRGPAVYCSLECAMAHA